MVALLGAVIAAISPILPWATFEFNSITIPGYYQSYITQYITLPALNIPASGFETIIYPTFFSFFLVVLSIALFSNDERRRNARGLLIVAGGFVMLMTYVYAISAAIMAKDAVYSYYLLFANLLGTALPANYLQNLFPRFSIAIGGYVALLGAVLTIVGGFWALMESRSQIPPPPDSLPR